MAQILLSCLMEKLYFTYNVGLFFNLLNVGNILYEPSQRWLILWSAFQTRTYMLACYCRISFSNLQSEKVIASNALADPGRGGGCAPGARPLLTATNLQIVMPQNAKFSQFCVCSLCWQFILRLMLIEVGLKQAKTDSYLKSCLYCCCLLYLFQCCLFVCCCCFC